MSFQKATKKNARLRLSLQGPAGAGKTYSALQIAQQFGSKIAVMDSERGSASLYADIFDFDVCELEEKNVQEYLERIRDAAEAGYEVLVIDSYSHSWVGALETIDKMGGWVKGGKVVSPLVAKLVDAVLSYPGHVIATMRSKTEYAIEQNDRGKATMRKLGMAPVVRDGTEYEFGVVLDLAVDGTVSVSKSRCRAVPVGYVFSREEIPKIATALKAWLSDGAEATLVDALKERLRFATTREQLAALVPEIGKCSAEEKLALRAPYLAKKREIEGVGE